MQFKTWLLFISLLSLSCKDNASPGNVTGSAQQEPITAGTDNPYAHISNIPLPAGFSRQNADSNSFAKWLRRVELKKDKTVYKYNGVPKGDQSAQFAVLNISRGDKDLQQCADAVMRLRAEYLFSRQQFDQIIFYDNDRKPYALRPPYTRENFMVYLNRVFGMCGSASLSKQLKPLTDPSAIEAGDVLIRGGFPGHAVIVMDVASNSAGRKIYLLAQGYMPAQDIHVLINPTDPKLSPWYEVNDNEQIVTPEYLFYRKEWMHW